MTKSSERFLRTKKRSLSDNDTSATYKTEALRSRRRPVEEPAVARRPVDDPPERALFTGDYTSND